MHPSPPHSFPPLPPPLPSPAQLTISCSKGNKRPQPRKGSPSQLVREAEWKREPAPTLIASYRLWSSPPPAEPRCFPPSSRSSLGTQAQERDTGVNRPRGVWRWVWHRSALAAQPGASAALGARESAAAAAGGQARRADAGVRAEGGRRAARCWAAGRAGSAGAGGDGLETGATNR